MLSTYRVVIRFCGSGYGAINFVPRRKTRLTTAKDIDVDIRSQLFQMM
jgi:hypothetical protein